MSTQTASGTAAAAAAALLTLLISAAEGAQLHTLEARMQRTTEVHTSLLTASELLDAKIAAGESRRAARGAAPTQVAGPDANSSCCCMQARPSAWP